MAVSKIKATQERGIINTSVGSGACYWAKTGKVVTVSGTATLSSAVGNGTVLFAGLPPYLGDYATFIGVNSSDGGQWIGELNNEGKLRTWGSAPGNNRFSFSYICA